MSGKNYLSSLYSPAFPHTERILCPDCETVIYAEQPCPVCGHSEVRKAVQQAQTPRAFAAAGK